MANSSLRWCVVPVLLLSAVWGALGCGRVSDDSEGEGAGRAGQRRGHVNGWGKRWLGAGRGHGWNGRWHWGHGCRRTWLRGSIGDVGFGRSIDTRWRWLQYVYLSRWSLVFVHTKE